MINRGKYSVLGVGILAVEYEYAAHRVIEAARQRTSLSVAALAIHGVMTGVNDRAHRRRLNGLDLVLPDGQPVRWALNWIHGVGLRDRVLGPQLTLEAVEAAAKEHLSVYFYEGNKDTLHRFVKNLQHIFPQLIVADPEPSKFRRLSQQEKQDVAERVEDSGARLSCSSAWAAHARKYGFMSTKTA